MYGRCLKKPVFRNNSAERNLGNSVRIDVRFPRFGGVLADRFSFPPCPSIMYIRYNQPIVNTQQEAFLSLKDAIWSLTIDSIGPCSIVLG